jgi:hypothetical protein
LSKPVGPVTPVAAPTQDALVQHLERADEDKQFPFLPLYRHAQRTLDGFKLHTKEFRAEEGIRRAKGRFLTREDSMSLTYLIAGDESSRGLFTSMLLSVPDQLERVRLHNWYVAHLMGHAWLIQHGKAVAKLVDPLFPPLPEYADLNARLLLETGEGQVTGGATSLYLERKKAVVKPATAAGGAPLFPVLSDGAGGYAVDMAPAAAGHATLAAQIASLQAQVAALSRGGGAWLAPASSAPQQPGALGDRGGRGGRGRGRGGRGGATGGGDDAPPGGF